MKNIINMIGGSLPLWQTPDVKSQQYSKYRKYPSHGAQGYGRNEPVTNDRNLVLPVAQTSRRVPSRALGIPQPGSTPQTLTDTLSDTVSDPSQSHIRLHERTQ
jgi:hypothetical protein